MVAHMILETAPKGALLEAYLNGRSLGIVESNPETAFSYWGERARNGARAAERNGEKRPRVYTLRRRGSGIEYRFINGEWRAA
ncbi:MAG: hypothetical protein EOQ56_28160 [Mesorhizobium sp.]|nr:MAG: hypothetical protein EOQ56_28160 [Mesorhizobium sp.]